MQNALALTPALFPLIFVAAWFGITTLLSVTSGWLSLMTQFPDRPETAISVFRGRSGSMGGVSMRGLLRISVCSSGLRFGMNRLFGVFSRDFFVPWNQLKIIPVTTFFMNRTQFQFRSGASIVGKLTMAPEEVARIGVAAINVAPAGMFLPPEANSQIGKRLFVQWLVSTLFASAFFTLVSRLLMHASSSRNVPHIETASDLYPPWPVTVLFPAIVFGIAAIVAYLRARSEQQPSER